MSALHNAKAPPGGRLYPVAPADDLAAYDQLPPAVRARVASAPVNVAAGPLLRFWRSDLGDCVARHAALISALDHAFPEIRA